MSILIKNALLDEIKQDIFIEGNKIARIGQNLTFKAQKVINATGKAAIPSLINGHTHAAMTLLRGFADDMPLKEWLETKIWPMEAKLTQEDIYWGTRLAALEMIKSGTTFFNDMYWYPETAAKAVEDSGIRALINHVIIGSTENSKEEQVNKLLKLKSSTVDIGLGPHAIYTVPKEGLVWAKKVADQNNIKLHIHLSETRQEVIDCQKVNRCRPVEYLQEIGFLGPNVIAAHGVWLNDHEIKILKHHDVKIIHCPTSNMKLASGNSLPYNKLRENKISLGLGTDGCSSNNNLDMFEEMKMASLLQKHDLKSATVLSANEAFEMGANAKIFGLDCGKIEEGKLADLLLIDLENPDLIPNYNLRSNLVYSANGSCVDTTICNGKVLMENKMLKDEEKIIGKAKEFAKAHSK